MIKSIKESKSLIGEYRGDVLSKMEDFSSTLPQKFNFCPVVKSQIHTVQNKNIITIEVEEAPKYQKPIFIKDAGPLKGGYKRIGSSDIRLKDEDVHRFFIERMGSPDSLILEDTTTDDLDISSLNAFKELRRLINPAAPELKFDDEGILKSYNLTDRKDKLKSACILLFGKEKVVREYFPAFRVDIIRIKGTGLKTTREELKKEGYPLPEYLNDPANDTFTLILPHPVSGVTSEDAQQVTDQDMVQHKDKFFQDLMGPIDSMVKVVDFCKEPKYLKEIMAFLNYKHRPTFVKKILKPLLDKRLIKMTIPDKPRSQHQKYVTVMKEKNKRPIK